MCFPDHVENYIFCICLVLEFRNFKMQEYKRMMLISYSKKNIYKGSLPPSYQNNKGYLTFQCAIQEKSVYCLAVYYHWSSLGQLEIQQDVTICQFHFPPAFLRILPVFTVYVFWYAFFLIYTFSR